MLRWNRNRKPIRSGPVAWCCFAVLCTGVAWCQAPSSEKHIQPGADVYGGFSRVAPDFSDDNSNPAAIGFGGGTDVYIFRWFAVAAEVHWMHVTYNPEENSTSVTAFGGPRFFLDTHRRIVPFADILGGVATFNFHGNPSNFTSTNSAAFAADAGVDVRIAGPVAVRVEGGYVHSGFTSVYSMLQPFVHDQHGRLLVEGVWHF